MRTRKSPISCEKRLTTGFSGSQTFKKAEHLKKRNDIRSVFSKGKQYSCRAAKLFVLKNNLPYNRICFTLSRGFGNAVQRNRAKRLSREAYRLLKLRLIAGYDLILLVYAGDQSAVLCDRIKQMEFLFTKAGLL